MKRRKWWIGGCVLLLTSGVGFAETLEEVEKQLNEAFARHKSIKARVSIFSTMEPFGQNVSMSGEGTYELLRQDGVEYIRLEVASTTTFRNQEEPKEVASTSLSVADGKFCWTLREQLGRKSVVRQHPRQAQQLGSADAFGSLRQQHILRLLPDETIDGKRYRVIEAVLHPAIRNNPLRKRVLYFDPEFGGMLKMIVTNEAAQPVEYFTVSDLQTDVPIETGRFVFEVPPDAPVVDEQGGLIAEPKIPPTPPPAPSPTPAPTAAPSTTPAGE